MNKLIVFIVVIFLSLVSFSLDDNLIKVESGSFKMGDEFGDLNVSSRPVHNVNISYNFYMGKYLITFEEYDLFCEDTNRKKASDSGWGREKRPVINVNWWDAIEYCNWLSEKKGLVKAYDKEGNLLDKNGNITTDIKKVVGYRLPTEAEWEFAARGGNLSQNYKYSGGNEVNSVAWYAFNSSGKTQPVGLKEHNELGFYDLSGNVFEWTTDFYYDYTSEEKNDPYIYKSDRYSSLKVIRGGSWLHGANFSRIGYRGNSNFDYSFSNRGFRIVRTDIILDIHEDIIIPSIEILESVLDKLTFDWRVGNIFRHDFFKAVDLIEEIIEGKRINDNEQKILELIILYYEGRIQSKDFYKIFIDKSIEIEEEQQKDIVLKGKGTLEEPFIISTPKELDFIRNNLNKHYELSNDINLSEYEKWIPIGFLDENNDVNEGFTGSINGNGYMIYNMTIYEKDNDFVGLFGKISNGAILKNIILKDINVYGNNQVGGLVGFVEYGFIQNCSVYGNISGNTRIGSIIGELYEGEIFRSYSNSYVVGNDYIGGLVGINFGEIIESFFVGKVECKEGDAVGGLTGYSGREANKEFNFAYIINSFARGTVKGNRYVGGLVGINFEGEIINCYYAGLVDGLDDVGGLVGWNNGLINRSYYDKSLSKLEDINKGEPKQTEEMKKFSTYSNWNFFNIWSIENNKSYPYLRWKGNYNQEYKNDYDDNTNILPKNYIDLNNQKGIHELDSMVLVYGGVFLMGNEGEYSSSAERPIHEVTLNYNFYIRRYLVTFKEYDDYCKEMLLILPDDNGWGRDKNPVINTSWYEIIDYCNWLSEKEGLEKAYDNKGNLLDRNGNITTDIKKVVGYRLPTEAEWEFAARGGNKSEGYIFSGSNNAEEVAWYGEYFGGNTNNPQPVGLKKPNELGIYDMSGNISEWTTDWYYDYLSDSRINPYVHYNDSYRESRVVRGGSFSNGLHGITVFVRYSGNPNHPNKRGFRVVRTSFNK